MFDSIMTAEIMKITTASKAETSMYTEHGEPKLPYNVYISL